MAQRSRCLNHNGRGGYILNRSSLLASLLLLLWASTGAAQATSFEWVPYGGIFVPTTDLAVTTIDDSNLAVRQSTGAIFGARLVAWWSRVVGWEGNFAYALSDAQLKDDGGEGRCNTQGTNCSANVWFASSKLLFRYFPQPYKGWYVFAGAGFAVAGHVGDFWERADATTDLGGVIGIGGVIDISRVFAVRIDAEDYIYNFEAKVENDPELGTFVASSELQNDLVFTAGVVIRLSGM